MSKLIGTAMDNAKTNQRAKLQAIETQKVYDLLEYVAMMADVEIPEAEEGEDNE